MSVVIPSHIRVISFDLDDTLWSGTQVILHAEQVMQNWMQENTPAVLSSLSPNALRQKKIEFIKSHPQYAHKMSAAREIFLRGLFDEFGYDAPDQLAQACFSEFYQARQQVILFDDVIETLTQLQKTYQLIAITNGNADIHQTGLGEHFEFCLQAEDFSQPKPAPEIFQHALDRVGLTGQSVLHVGDHPVQDMKGAFEAGMHTCWLNDGSREWREAFEPHMTITHVRELVGL